MGLIFADLKKRNTIIHKILRKKVLSVITCAGGSLDIVQLSIQLEQLNHHMDYGEPFGDDFKANFDRG